MKEFKIEPWENKADKLRDLKRRIKEAGQRCKDLEGKMDAVGEEKTAAYGELQDLVDSYIDYEVGNAMDSVVEVTGIDTTRIDLDDPVSSAVRLACDCRMAQSRGTFRGNLLHYSRKKKP